MLPPTVIGPHGIAVMVLVQALFVYTAMFGEVVTVPDESIFWLTAITASVLAPKEHANTIRIIVSIFCILCDVMLGLFPDKQ